MDVDTIVYTTKYLGSKRLYNTIMEDEGFERFPYKDIVGKTTIGYGRNLEDNGITQREAEFMLYNDVYKAYLTAKDIIPHWGELNNVRQEAFINMAFNLGTRIKSFKRMLEYLKNKDYDMAAMEMLDSKWHKQVGKRAERLAYMVRYGVYKD